jgi:hypothetical protein
MASAETLMPSSCKNSLFEIAMTMPPLPCCAPARKFKIYGKDSPASFFVVARAYDGWLQQQSDIATPENPI